MVNIKKLWKTRADNKNIKAYDVAAYMIIRAIHAKTNDKLKVARALLQRAFTPITNENKLNNGCKPFDGLQRAINNAGRSELTNELSALTLGVFIDMVKALKNEDWQAEPDVTFCYIVTRSDLPPIHQLVQTAHATMVAGQTYNEVDANNLHFCVLNGGNEKELLKFCTKLTVADGISYVWFREPDANRLWNGKTEGEVTAIACKPMKKSFAKKNKLFEGKELLSF